MVTASKERPHPCAADYIRSATTRARFKRYLVNYAREGWRKIRDKDKGLYNITFLFMSWSAGGRTAGDTTCVLNNAQPKMMFHRCGG